MRQTCVPLNITRSTKLQGTQQPLKVAFRNFETGNILMFLVAEFRHKVIIADEFLLYLYFIRYF